MTPSPLDISVVVPLFNEDESLPELGAWIARVMAEHGFRYEVLFIDDGSTDRSWLVIESLCEQYPSFRGIRFTRNYGKSAALHTGFQAALGRVVITMDADLQDSPDEIPELYRMITEDGYDLVSGWKQKRFDPLTKTLPTKLFNAVSRAISGVQLHDFNCGLKAYNARVVKNIRLYGEMHRNIPILAKWNGFGRIGEKVVQHRPRKYGTTKFGLERFIYGFLDVLTITFVNRFGKRPMHLFGSLGVFSFFLGTLATLWLGIDKIYSIYTHQKFRNLTDDPKFFLALIAMVIGVQLFLAGFLGELLASSSERTTDYRVRERVGFGEKV
jgi:glycosyltransferase involved in cell wall biosynthesis